MWALDKRVSGNSGDFTLATCSGVHTYVTFHRGRDGYIKLSVPEYALAHDFCLNTAKKLLDTGA